MALEAGTTEAEIKASAEKIVGGKRIDVWTVGTTGNLDIRRERHGRPSIWHYWKSESEQTSKIVEAYFKAKGMKGYTGADAATDKATYVYIAWI
jgi:hypothetical protein